METNCDFNQSDIPIKALRSHTREKIKNGLDKRKVLASEEKYPRDWRGLAQLAELEDERCLDKPGRSPTEELLKVWEKKPDATFGKLKEFLGRIDRWDVEFDVGPLMRKDAEHYLASKRRCVADGADQQAIDYNMDSDLLFNDDIRRVQDGLDLVEYDALLLYADKDQAFAREMLNKLVNDYDLKVCLKEDIIAGLSFEHQIMRQLISKRCRHVIIIFSSHFMHSQIDVFSVSYAQSLSIENKSRIIIPCMYEKVELPEDIRMLYKLDYTKTTLRGYNFWERLKDSVVKTPQRSPPVVIQELNTSEYHQPKNQVTDTVTKPPSCTSSQETFKCKMDQVNMKEKERFCSTISLQGSYESSCSTLSLSEKDKTKKKSKYSNFIKKMFSTSKTSKSKKIAIRL